MNKYLSVVPFTISGVASSQPLQTGSAWTHSFLAAVQAPWQSSSTLFWAWEREHILCNINLSFIIKLVSLNKLNQGLEKI